MDMQTSPLLKTAAVGKKLQEKGQTVWVVNLRYELHLWRKMRILFREGQDGFEEPSLAMA